MSLALLIVIVFGLTHDSATWGLITGLAYLGAFDLFNVFVLPYFGEE